MALPPLDVPVIAAPMAGVSTPSLVAAVCAAGGSGFLAAGYREVAAMVDQIRSTRRATDRPFGVNLFVPEQANTYVGRMPGPSRVDLEEAVEAYRARLQVDAQRWQVDLPEPDWTDTDFFEEKVDALAAEQVAMVSFTFGLPGQAVLERLQRRGIVTAITVTDEREANQANEIGADLLVVQGSDAGGHRGTMDALAVPREQPLAELLAQVRAVSGLPVVAAGGVGSPDDVTAAIEAGAWAVQVGTALLRTAEAGTHPVHRAMLAQKVPMPIATTRVFSGRLGRVLSNDFVSRHADAPPAYPVINQLTTPIRRAAMEAGDPAYLPLWAGAHWREAKAVPAAEVVRELATGA